MTQPNHGGPVLVGGRLDLPVDADFVMEIVIPDGAESFLLTDKVQWHFADDDGEPLLIDDVPVVWDAELVEDADNPGTSRLIRFEVDETEVRPVALVEPGQARLHFVRGDPPDDLDLLWDVWSTRRV